MISNVNKETNKQTNKQEYQQVNGFFIIKSVFPLKGTGGSRPSFKVQNVSWFVHLFLRPPLFDFPLETLKHFKDCVLSQSVYTSYLKFL
jgi:hypothetical protein